MGDIAIIIGGRNLSDLSNGTDILEITTPNPNSTSARVPGDVGPNLGFNIGVGVGSILAVILILAAFRGILLHKIVHSRAYRHLKRRLNRGGGQDGTKYGSRHPGNQLATIPVLTDTDFAQLRELAQDSRTENSANEITVVELSGDSLSKDAPHSSRKSQVRPSILVTPAERIVENGQWSPYSDGSPIGTLELNHISPTKRAENGGNVRTITSHRGRHVTKVRIMGDAVTTQVTRF